MQQTLILDTAQNEAKVNVVVNWSKAQVQRGYMLQKATRFLIVIVVNWKKKQISVVPSAWTEVKEQVEDEDAPRSRYNKVTG